MTRYNPIMVEGATDRECSKVESTKRMQAATKSSAEAATEAVVVACRFVALKISTANCTVVNAERRT